MSKYNTQLQLNNTDLQTILQSLQNKAAGGGGLDTSDATAAPSDILKGKTAYVDGEKITGSIETVAQATPTVTINTTNGLITATATQTAGYVTSGSKSGTKQLAFQAAKTITPGTTDQTAVGANYYTGGAITVKGDSNLVAENIVSGKSIFGVVGTATVGSDDDPFATGPFAYTVDSISGASYGFALNGNGYYESQNKGMNNSYAICRVNFTVTSACDIVFDVINYAESSFDYAIMGKLDTALTLSNRADSNCQKNFQGLQSASVVNVTYSGVTVGNHYVDIKFIKDGSTSSGNDSVQFKIQGQVGLSQETIDKILAADTDLVAENIKSGIDIFGVIGTYEGASGGGSGDTSGEDSLITRQISTYENNRVTTIGYYAFAYCASLISVNFPQVTTIGGNAFCGCNRLTSASFPKAISINSSAFCYCDKLTTANFPQVTTIGGFAFSACASLTTVSFPQATTIGGSAFSRCASLTTVSFPQATTIGGSAFYRCSSLTTVSFPQVITIGGGAFSGCSKLTTVSFPQATTIGDRAFFDCSILSTVSFPKVITIDDRAFFDCYSLSTIYLGNSVVCSLLNSNAFSYTGIGSNKGSIFVPASLVDSYKAATNWAFFSNRIFSYAF